MAAIVLGTEGHGIIKMARLSLRLALGLLVLGASFIVFMSCYVFLGDGSFRVLDVVNQDLIPAGSLAHVTDWESTRMLVTTTTGDTLRPSNSLHTTLLSLNASSPHERVFTTGTRPSTEFVSESDSTAPVSEEGNELDVVLSRVRTCLDATNVTWHFKNEGYYAKAHADAELIFKGLRRGIPTFTEPYTAPCWKTPFHASWVAHSVKGNVGDFNFDHTVTRDMMQYRRPKVAKGDHLTKKDQWTVLQQSVACLPKILLLGYPKCGSTYLYCFMRRVLQLALGIEGMCEVEKEPHWWIVPGPTKRLQPRDADYLSLYLINFYPGARYRERDKPVVTIDASPNLMFQWPRYYKDETMENYCLLPSLIPVILPDTKYIVVMRSPLTMLYSAFWFSCTLLGKRLVKERYEGPDIFHNRINRKIGVFNDCKRQRKPLDVCVDQVAPNMFDPALPSCGRIKLDQGLYYFHVRKWLSVVPRERIHFFTLEELSTQDQLHTAQVILDFLELPSLTHSSLNIKCGENTQYAINYKHDPRLMMREDTRQIIEEFFQPYNQMLADLLGDDKFLWK